MPKKNAVFVSTTLLALAVGIFLLLSGIQTLVDLNSPFSKAAQGLGKLVGVDQTSGVLTVVFAILKIASGGVLVVGPFGLLTTGIRKLAFWVIVGFWAVLTLWLAYAGAVQVRGGQGTILGWLQEFSLNIAILAALWQLKPEGK